MTLIARLRRAVNTTRLLALAEQQRDIIRRQEKYTDKLNELLDRQQQQIDRLHQFNLEQTRDMQGLAYAWLIHCDNPEIDMRPELVEKCQALGEQIAVLEEHIL